MYKRILCFLMGLLVVLRVDAGALPNFSGSVNKAVAQTIEKTAIRRGFAANDPRVAATYTGAAGVAATIAADVAVAAATAAAAPAWLTLAAGLGAAAIVGGLAYGAYKVFFDDDSSAAKFVLRTTTGTPTGTVTTPSGSNTYVQSGLKVDSAGHIVGSTRLRIPNGVFNFHGITVYCDEPTTCMQLAVQGWINLGGGTGAVFDVPCSAEVNSVITCGARRIGSGGNTTPQSTWMTGTYQFSMINNPFYSATVKGKISDIAAAVPQTELDKAADASVIASLANMLWQRAASQPGYQGVPYSTTDPVTTADAASVQSANPSTWPSNSELIAPVASGAGQAVPISPAITPGQPSTNPSTDPAVGTNVNVVNTPNVNVVNKVQVDLGADPAVATPVLESAPTAKMILDPLLNLFPTLKNFTVPSHESICPKPTMNLFGKSLVLSAHCDLLESIRATLYATMAFVWTIAAMFIILRA